MAYTAYARRSIGACDECGCLPLGSHGTALTGASHNACARAHLCFIASAVDAGACPAGTCGRASGCATCALGKRLGPPASAGSCEANQHHDRGANYGEAAQRCEP